MTSSRSLLTPNNINIHPEILVLSSVNGSLLQLLRYSIFQGGAEPEGAAIVSWQRCADSQQLDCAKYSLSHTHTHGSARASTHKHTRHVHAYWQAHLSTRFKTNHTCMHVHTRTFLSRVFSHSLFPSLTRACTHSRTN